MGKWTGILAAACVVFVAGVALGARQTAGASRREPQFENGMAKSWKSIIMPNQPLSLHRHDHARAIMALTSGTLDLVDATGKTMKQMTWEAGKAYWYEADPPNTQHADLNRGAAPIEVIVVEMQTDQKP